MNHVSTLSPKLLSIGINILPWSMPRMIRVATHLPTAVPWLRLSLAAALSTGFARIACWFFLVGNTGR